MVLINCEKSHKYSFFSNTGPEPMKNQASIQCWAIIGPPAKRQMAFRWRADDGPLLMVWQYILDPRMEYELDWILQPGGRMCMWVCRGDMWIVRDIRIAGTRLTL